MAELIKAVLIELSDKKLLKEVARLPVQFNPSSLHLVTSNRVTGGENAGQAVRQSLGTSGRTFTVTLEFDSSDEGEARDGGRDAKPVSVAGRIAWIECFLLPRSERHGKSPRLRFQWGEFLLDGIAESLDVTYTHFAADGTPLRATAALSMREQDERYALKTEERAKAAKWPLGDTRGEGAQADGGSRVAVALEGETAAELAVRVGLDPRAWRKLGADAGAGPTLPAGTEVAFHAGLDAGLGLGVRAGAAAGIASSTGLSMNRSAGVARQGSAVDRRAASFGRGIPLRARTETAALPTLRSTRGGRR